MCFIYIWGQLLVSYITLLSACEIRLKIIFKPYTTVINTMSYFYPKENIGVLSWLLRKTTVEHYSEKAHPFFILSPLWQWLTLCLEYLISGGQIQAGTQYSILQRPTKSFILILLKLWGDCNLLCYFVSTVVFHFCHRHSYYTFKYIVTWKKSSYLQSFKKLPLIDYSLPILNTDW